MSEEVGKAEEVKVDESPKLPVEKTVDEGEPDEQTQNPVNGNCNGPEDDEIKKPEAGEIPPKQEVKETEQEKKQEKQAEKSLEIEKSEVKSDSETEKKVTEPEVNQSEVAPEQAETEETKEEPMEEGVDEDDDEDDDSEEELPPGLLERPVEILKEKRERKKTTRFTYDDVPTPSSEKKKLEIAEGRGVKLSDHPRVEWQLQRNKIEDLKIIHKLFFGVFGDLTCKKNMRNFSGFPFDKDTPEFEKKEDYLGRFTLDNLKWALTVCDVEPRQGKKEELMDRFLEWCLCPKPSGKPIPEKKAKKEKPIKKKKKKKAKKTSEKSNKSVNDSSITSSDVSEDESESEKEIVTPKKPKQTKKTPKKQTPKAAPKKATPKSPKKRKATTTPKKIAKVKIGSPKKSDEVDSDDGDVPLTKRAKNPPTNTQIRKDVANILKGADLEVITMKAVCMKVYSLYPEFDLSEKKAFIKETVKAIIS